MTIFPFHINEVMHVYNRISKLRASVCLENEETRAGDIVNISAEAKKKQVIAEARSDVLEIIRETR